MPELDVIDPIAATPSLEGMQRWLGAHLADGAHPLNAIDIESARSVVESLTSIEPESWAMAWLAVADGFAAQASRSEGASIFAEAREAWWQAYRFAFMGRFPTPTHSAKEAAYDVSREYFLRAVSLDAPSVQRIEVAVDNPDREGRENVVFYLARPRAEFTGALAVVIVCGGIDMWKEETYVRTEGLRARGIATLHVDIPGVGEAPLYAGVNAERMWNPVFDWIETSGLDARRVGLLGQSFGGYWSTKLAHTHRDRIRAAVNWGGGIHRTFQPVWQERARAATAYIMDLGASRARIFGGHTLDDYISRCPELSLLDQGVLDLPCSPLLLVNGKDDQQSDATDISLALEHGEPKTARMFPGGHMGTGPVEHLVFDWLASQLI